MQDQRKVLVLHWHRFKILAVVFMCSLVLEFCWVSTVWIRRLSNRNEGPFLYTFLRYYNEFAFLLFFPTSVWLIEAKGPKTSVILAMVLAASGMWLLTLSTNFTAPGEILVGSAQPFIINTFTKWSASWFGPKGRSISTMFLLISVFLPLAYSDIDINSVQPLLKPLSIVTTLLIFVSAALLKDRPLFPPTLSEEEKRIEPTLAPS